MRELRLIVRREYLSRVKKKSFFILTILMPILLLASVLMPLLLVQFKDSEIKSIAVVDLTGKYASHLHSFDEYIFETVNTNLPQLKAELGQDLFCIIQINNDLLVHPDAITLYSERQIPSDLQNYITRTIDEVLKQQQMDNLVEDNTIDKETLSKIQIELTKCGPLKLNTISFNDDAEKESSTDLSSSIALLFSLLMYFFILMYGTMVLNGVVEEKSSRIVEILICSVRPFNLMMGKIIGIGLCGLTQLSIWFIVAALVFTPYYLSADPFFQEISVVDFVVGFEPFLLIDWVELIGFFLLLFIGGYLIYASIFAMFGAAVDNSQDTQQFVMPVTILFIFALYAGFYSMQNPDGSLAFWCSMIPFTSPIVMMVRIPFGVPLCEKILSIVILYTTIIFIVHVSAKIYRVAILMYGKKASLADLYKWFKLK